MKGIVFCLILACLTGTTYAGVEIRKFENFEQEQRYHRLIDELRCLVCQNQNLADSDAELAQQLRSRIYQMIRDGKTDSDITDFMVSRYGEFVLYNPPLDTVTAILWGGPFLLLFIGLFFLLFYIQKQVKRSPSIISDEEKARARKLLEDNEDETS